MSLVNMGVSQNEALNVIDNLIKMGSIDYALAEVERMELQYYAKETLSSIFQGNDDRYHVFIPIGNGKRKHIVSKNKSNLEKKIVEFYKLNEDVIPVISCTLKDIYPRFIKYKQKDSSMSNAKKINWAYNKYICGTDFELLEIPETSSIQIKEFCLDAISKYKLTNKGYKELKSLLNSLYAFAVDGGIIQINPAKQMSRINSNKMVQTQILPETQVFTMSEERMLYESALNLFDKQRNSSYLGIVLSGCLGLRVGELVALKYDDFDVNSRTVKIRRQEIRHISNTQTYSVSGYDIVNYLKTKESLRDLPMTDHVYKIYLMIKAHNDSLGLNSGYLFVSERTKERKHCGSIANALQVANKHAGLTQRSNHKLRKTLLSELENSIGKTKTRAFAGHSRNSVVLEQNYLYPITPLSSDTEIIGEILDGRLSILS